MSKRLKIAVQKSGRLLDESLGLLKACGLRVDNHKGQLKASVRDFPVDILYLRNADIPKYVQDGVADVGILGQNTIIEKDCSIEEVMPLGFSKCRLSIAVPKSVNYPGSEWLNGKKIATSYPNSLKQFLRRHKLQADIHEISGSVEIAPNIGLADAICDLVSSGSTLFKNGLEEQEVILKSEAVMVATPGLATDKREILETLAFRIKSVLAGRKHRYLLMNAPDSQVEAITKILPGMRSPTVMPLAQAGWSSIHTVIMEDGFWNIIDDLRQAGAEGILIVPIEKMIR